MVVIVVIVTRVRETRIKWARNCGCSIRCWVQGKEIQSIGDKVGVGCMVGACHSCENCKNDLENYCPKSIFSYNATYYDQTRTYGGYSDVMVANERYVILMPENLPLDAAAPYCVLGSRTSPSKEKEAIQHLGADSFLISRNPDQMQAAMNTLDGIIDTVSAVHPLQPLFGLLKSHGKLILIGAPEKPLELPVLPLLMGRKLAAGSFTGGMKETQEMIDFAGKHNITADIEIIPMDYVNTAMDRLSRADVKYRFVIDIAKTLNIA
ncbi:hypothetical protein NE237_029843 [Protea cynaroides]|uniref:Uncharacterized protein n=1 Tax=Protea cynaroides TaxID=273540 RepID=A0A9Q0JV74_9MAGN|nr:hypothetical protein NE237_029843 [Protea cynaroides]